jgi:Glycosyltransferase family 87
VSAISLARTRFAHPSRVPGALVRLAKHPALLAAGATLLLGWGALAVTHKATPLPVPPAAALRQVLGSRSVDSMLRSTHWTRWDVTPIDSHDELLGFYRGARMVANVTLHDAGQITVTNATDLTHVTYAYGNDVANNVWVLAMLSVLFILMTAVWPLWRVRNLDVLVATSTVLSVILYDKWMLSDMVLVSYPALIYLAVRCTWYGFGRRRERAATTPLYERLTSRWEPDVQLRVLRLIAVALTLVVVIVGLTSLQVIDVGYAVMEGATAILHGLLPYGHIPDVFHGDTYPLGSYALYVPFAWISPVHNVWGDADATLYVAVAAALLALLGLFRLGRTHAATPGAAARASTAALRGGIAWLAFPPLLVTVSTGTTDVALAAMLVGVLLLWRRPAGSVATLAGAAWFKLVPVALLPLWLARLRGRALLRATAAAAAVTAVFVGLLVVLGGVHSPLTMASAVTFQFTRSSPHTLWALTGSVPLQQLVQAATLAVLVGGVVRIRRDRAFGDDRARLAALGAAVLIGLQVAANYWNYMYLVWVLPFLLVSILDTANRPAQVAQAQA